MQTEITDTLIRNIDALSPEDQKRALEYIEKLAKRRSSPRLPIFEKLDEITSEIPDEDLDDIPTDSSVNVDHYLYGSPKR